MSEPLKILILEDVSEDSELIIYELKKANLLFTHKIVQTEKDFLFALNFFNPNIILCDYSLPTYDGLSALLMAKNVLPDIPFIIVTGTLGDEKAVEILKAGAVDYILKNHLLKLPSAITRALEEYKQKTEKKALDKTLLNSRERYRAVVDDMPALICRFLPDGTLTFVNNSYCEYFNKKRNDLIGYNFLKFVPPEEHERIIKNFKSLNKENPSISYEHAIISPSGEIRYQNWIDRILLDESDYPIEYQSIGIDITDKKNAENTLKENEEKFRALFETMAEGVVIINENGKIMSANQSAKKIMGLSNKKLINKTPFDSCWKAIHEDGTDFQSESHPVMLALKTGKEIKNAVMGVYNPIHKKHKWIRINAVPQILNGEGKPNRVYATFSDMSDLKDKENILIHRIEIEKLISEISSRFISHDIENINSIINQSLKSIGEFGNIDRSYVFLLNEDSTKGDNTYEWCASGIEPQIENLKDLSVDSFPWWMKKLNNYETIHIPRVSDLPAEAKAEKEILQLQSIQSLLVVPLIYGNSLLGFLGLDSVKEEKKWLSEDIELLKIIANIFASALESCRKEEKLLKSEEQFRQMATNIHEVFWMADADMTKILYVSPAFERIWGRTCQNLYDNPKLWMDAVHPEDIQRVYTAFIRNRASGEEFNEEYRIVRPDGSICWVWNRGVIVRDKNGCVCSITGVASDITERKQAEEERIRLATTIEQVYECIVITDSNGTIQFVNPAFEKITGYSREEAIGKNPRIVKSGKQDEDFYKRLWNTILSGYTWKGHFINRKKDGTLYNEEATISPILDSNGNITNFIAVKRDVTNEIIMEQRLRETQKMEAIGTLAGGIAHDFNNILSAIMGYTELSMDQVSENSQLHSDLKRIYIASNRARDLVNQILTLSRQREQERKPIKIKPIIKETLKLLRASLPSNIEIRQHIDPESGTILADPTQIHQVVMNLCTNAGHAMREDGGILEVSLTNIVLDSDFIIQHPTITPGPYLKLMVSDTGHGIDKDVLERIFEPYFTTKEKSGGTGLGLAVVHRIITSYGGAIKAYSEPGKGSTFKVYLPVIEEEPDAEVEKTKSIAIGNEHILFIDDETDIKEVGKRILESLGYKVVTQTSSTEALELFQKDPNQFDLVITDMTMPSMTGDELAKELLHVRPDIPIIICTGYSEKITEEKALCLGIRAYLGKPLIKSEIAETVRRVLDKNHKD